MRQHSGPIGSMEDEKEQQGSSICEPVQVRPQVGERTTSNDIKNYAQFYLNAMKSMQACLFHGFSNIHKLSLCEMITMLCIIRLAGTPLVH